MGILKKKIIDENFKIDLNSEKSDIKPTEVLKVQ